MFKTKFLNVLYAMYSTALVFILGGHKPLWVAKYFGGMAKKQVKGKNSEKELIVEYPATLESDRLSLYK